jgi:hypothetical protein
MKKKLTMVIYFLSPSLLSGIFICLSPYIGAEAANIVIACFYVPPVCGICYFIVKKPFNQWLLPVGFVPVPLLFLIYEYSLQRDIWRYLVSALVTAYYFIPFIVLSLIVALIITIHNKRRNKHSTNILQ